ncbi:MAG: zinc ribbon domain-containing protein [Nitrosomonas sp.]|nr:zinc ribbon domain-containing protein [Nitrosomonas sp.]
MPIYEYACRACGFEKEHFQKMSDALIANCPACNSSEYIKKVSAAGFRLKGTGWYATDFKNPKTTKSDSATKGDKKTDAVKPAEASGTQSAPAATTATTTTAATES